MTLALLLILAGLALMYVGFLHRERHQRRERQREMMRHLEEVCK